MIHRGFLAGTLCMMMLSGGAALGASAGESELTPAQRAVALVEQDDVAVGLRLAEVRILVAEHEDNGAVWTAYGELLEMSGDSEAALMAFERAIKLDDSIYTPWLWLGLLAKRGLPNPDLARAEECFRKAVERGAPKARALNELAVTIAMRGRMAEARDLWLQAIPNDPDWGVLYNNLINAALSLGDEKTAAAQIEPALKAARFSEAPVLQLGEYYIRQKKAAQAEALYRRALEVHPTEPRFYLALGRVLADGGRKDAAVESFQSAKRLASRAGDNGVIAQSASWEIFRLEHPKDEKEFQSVRELVFSQESDARRRERDYRRALTRLDPLIRKHPEFWNAYFVRGVAHRRLDQRDQAKADLGKVLELNPAEANATMELALLHRDEFQFNEAADLAEKAVSLAPRDPIFAINAGFVLIEAGRCARAWELYRTALRMVGEQNTAPLRDMLELRCPDGEEATP
jgi:tetratricopeptide (TPR) repeat protein